jgi:short-subunit dehydrogenase
MLTRGEGYLLQTASAAGLLTSLAAAPYAVSKHAAVAFAEWLAITYRAQGLKVSVLCPQGVETAMLEEAGPVGELLRPEALSPSTVADAVVSGLTAETFLILPHPKVAHYLVHKATSVDAWLGAMSDLQASAHLSPAWPPMTGVLDP